MVPTPADGIFTFGPLASRPASHCTVSWNPPNEISCRATDAAMETGAERVMRRTNEADNDKRQGFCFMRDLWIGQASGIDIRAGSFRTCLALGQHLLTCRDPAPRAPFPLSAACPIWMPGCVGRIIPLDP